MDPFAPPDEVTAREPGRIDFGRVLVEAFQALSSNLLQIVGGSVLCYVAYLASICSLVGWIAVVPLLFWGLHRQLLEAVDGRTRARTVLSGFRHEQVVQLWARAAGLMLVLLVLALPLYTVELATAVYVDARTPLHPAVRSMGSQLVALVWGLCVVRLLLAPVILVDRGSGPLEALALAWRTTEGQWLPVGGIVVVMSLLSTPSSLLSWYVARYVRTLPPEQVIAEMTTWYSLVLLGSLSTWCAVIYAMACLAVAWRHLSDRDL